MDCIGPRRHNRVSLSVLGKLLAALVLRERERERKLRYCRSLSHLHSVLPVVGGLLELASEKKRLERRQADLNVYEGCIERSCRDTKRPGVDQILNKAMHARYFYFCVSMLRSENPTGG